MKFFFSLLNQEKIAIIILKNEFDAMVFIERCSCFDHCVDSNYLPIYRLWVFLGTLKDMS